MKGLLSFDQAPPFSAPLRFFLTAPLFALLAGLLLAWDGSPVLASRWTPGALAATHLLTVGFMLQVMLGALIQVLPVVAGVNMARPLRVSRWLHLGLSSGVLLLVVGFYFANASSLSAGGLILGGSVLGFLWLVIPPLARTPSTSPTIRGLKLAMMGLLGVVSLGVFLALAMAHLWQVPLMRLTDLHLTWGFAAWSGILLVAMAYVVVPMFQLTPGYPARLSWWFPGLLLAGVVLASLGFWFETPQIGRLAQGVLSLLGIGFCVFTMRLQFKRRRARADTTYRYWQLGLACMIFALFTSLTAAFWPSLAEYNEFPLLLGILLIVGGFIPLIIGMLYKIIPFLAWLHLQNLGGGKLAAPAMHKILSEKEMNRQLSSYALALVLLVGAIFWPEPVARVAGAIFALTSGWLFWNLLLAGRRYRRQSAIMREKLAKL